MLFPHDTERITDDTFVSGDTSKAETQGAEFSGLKGKLYFMMISLDSKEDENSRYSHLLLEQFKEYAHTNPWWAEHISGVFLDEASNWPDANLDNHQDNEHNPELEHNSISSLPENDFMVLRKTQSSLLTPL